MFHLLHGSLVPSGLDPRLHGDLRSLPIDFLGLTPGSPNFFTPSNLPGSCTSCMFCLTTWLPLAHAYPFMVLYLQLWLHQALPSALSQILELNFVSSTRTHGRLLLFFSLFNF